VQPVICHLAAKIIFSQVLPTIQPSRISWTFLWHTGEGEKWFSFTGDGEVQVFKQARGV